MRKIDRYQIFAEIKRGPITTVYKAYQEDLQRVVLLKVLNAEWIGDRDLVARFRREGQASARVRHPNVVSVYDFGFAEGVPYLVTEFVEGTTLADLIARVGRLPLELATYIAREVAAGLAAVHASGIVHRDVKPANIFLSEEGEVRLGDFGLAAERAEAGAAVAGTPAYLAPEAVSGAEVGPAADLFALGVTLYEMVLGDNPFADRTASRTLHHVVNLDPPPARRLRPEVPVELEEVCRRLLAKDPAQRLHSAASVAQALADLERRHGIEVGAPALLRFLQDPSEYAPRSWARPAPAEAASPEVETSSLSAGEAKVAAAEQSQGHDAEPPARSRRPERRPRVAWSMTAAAALLAVVAVAALIVRRSGTPPDVNEGAAQRTQPDTAYVSASLPEAQAQEQKRPQVEGEQRSEPEQARPESSRRVAVATKNDLTPQAPETAASVGWLLVVSDPRSIVFVDDDSVGATPVTAAVTLQAGEHQLCLQAPGWPRVCKTVTVAAGDTLAMHLSLWQEVGYLTVEVAPWAEVWMDGKYMDTTPLQGPLVVSPGEHVLEVRNPALGGRTERISVAAGDTLHRQYRLQPTPP